MKTSAMRCSKSLVVGVFTVLALHAGTGVAGASSSSASSGATPEARLARWYKDIPGYHPMWRTGGPRSQIVA